MSDLTTPATRLATVHDRIDRAARSVSRDPSGVTLVAVSKMFDATGILPTIVAGQRHFGENRVQDSLTKWPALKDVHPDVVLHLVGPLQSNKAREALKLFDAIHSLDRINLAEALATALAKSPANPTLFVQVNTGEEPQKSGVAPRDAERFVRQVREDFGLKVQGLMCIPPEAQEPSPHFAMLRQIAKDCQLPLLSMGMSGDFEAAIKLGATHIRVGTAIFGERLHHA